MGEPVTRTVLRAALLAAGSFALSLPAFAANPPPTELKAQKLVIDLKPGAKDESGEVGAVAFKASKTLTIDLKPGAKDESGEQGAVAFTALKTLTIDLKPGAKDESGEQGAVAFTASKLVIDLSQP